MRDGGVALVYAATRKNAEAYAQALKKAGMRARVYHAGLEDGVREKAQDVFMAGELDVIVATNAFGMGVDKSDIRLVVHADIPRSPEAYYQEAGRGGRDGKPTRCVLLFNHGDIRLQEFLIDASYPSAEVLRGLWKLLARQPELGTLDARRRRARGALKPHLPGDAVATRRSARRCGSSSATACSCATTSGSRRDAPAAGRRTRRSTSSRSQRRAEIERSKLRTMVDYAYYPRCRRQFDARVLRRRGLGDRAIGACGACDNCEAVAHGRTTGRVRASRRPTRSARCCCSSARCTAGSGASEIASLANGDRRRSAVRGAAGARLPARLVGASRCMDLLRALEGAGLVEASRGEYPTIATTRRGDLAAIGKLELGELGIQMPTVVKRVRKRR